MLHVSWGEKKRRKEKKRKTEEEKKRRKKGIILEKAKMQQAPQLMNHIQYLSDKQTQHAHAQEANKPCFAMLCRREKASNFSD